MLKRLNDSFSFDVELLEEDITASIAWAAALGEAGVFTAKEKDAVVAALNEVRSQKVEAGSEKAEDVHSFVEARLFEKLGPLAGKLHTGRSRNDQVATDFRLYLKKAFDEARQDCMTLVSALAARAEKEAATAMPGYTHLKQAEPITFGHWCLAYAEMILRDGSRLADAGRRADECPLGSGALAGTPLKIDREALARSLGFARASANSLDAVSDRDAAVEYLFAATLLLVHLSRLAEDLILFSSDEFGFVELPDALATGSSRMPQKKNPDVLELTRGHAGRAIGELTGLLAIMKGLPLAYNKDLQLDKEPVFRVRRTLGVLLPVLATLIETLELDRERMRKAASSDLLIATAAADVLALRGMSFREAHDRVGKAIASGTMLEDQPSLEAALDVKASRGGTAPARVREAAAETKRKLS